MLPANLTIVFLHYIKNATQAAHLHGEGAPSWRLCRGEKKIFKVN
jgi:hypothetical protein